MTDAVDRGLRGIFDEDAELYDRVRPGYPVTMFELLIEQADLGPHRRLLEIGPGTGKATVPLAMTGCQIIAVELGARLAARCANNLATFRRLIVAIASQLAFRQRALRRLRRKCGDHGAAWSRTRSRPCRIASSSSGAAR